MAKEFHGYFDSTADDERSYDASQFAQMLIAGMQNGVTSDSGGGLIVTPNGSSMTTIVSPGGIMINGYLYALSDDGGDPMIMKHSAAGAAERIDRIVTRLNLNGNAREITLGILEGVPSATPKPTALTRNGQIYELSIAQVRIRAATATILASDITDERGDETVCGHAVPVWLGNDQMSKIFAARREKIATATTDGLMPAADKDYMDKLKAVMTANGDGIDMRGKYIDNALFR